MHPAAAAVFSLPANTRSIAVSNGCREISVAHSDLRSAAATAAAIFGAVVRRQQGGSALQFESESRLRLQLGPGFENADSELAEAAASAACAVGGGLKLLSDSAPIFDPDATRAFASELARSAAARGGVCSGLEINGVRISAWIFESSLHDQVHDQISRLAS